MALLIIGELGANKDASSHKAIEDVLISYFDARSNGTSWMYAMLMSFHHVVRSSNPGRICVYAVSIHRITISRRGGSGSRHQRPVAGTAGCARCL